MGEIAFPESSEFITRRPTRVGLTFRRLLLIAYIFGGVSSLIAVASKFVIEPLFEQLTQDRREYAILAKGLFVRLNAKLTEAVSYVPPVSYTLGKRRYVDSQVQTGLPKQHGLKTCEADADTEKMKDAFRQLTVNSSVEQMGSMKQLLEGLSGYIHSLAYSNLRGALVDLSSLANRDETPKPDLIQELKKDIRAVKGSLLSG
jgi:hypothetical protein